MDVKAKKLRREGFVTGNLFGREIEGSIPLKFTKKEIEALGIPELNQILIDTVERFQGSERDVIIYSFCVNYPYQLKFLSNLTEEDGILIDRKLNVALTRARKQMLLTGVPALLERNPLYKSLLKLIESLRNIA